MRKRDWETRLAPEEILGWRLPASPDEAPPIQELVERLQGSDFNWKLLNKLIHFERNSYARMTLWRAPGCELILACWLPGQTSCIHDHGGSSGASVVLCGSLEETQYGCAGTRVIRRSSRCVHERDVLVEHPETIHRVANTSSAGAISLHLYTPPIRGMNSYQEPRSLSSPDASGGGAGGTPSARARSGSA
jgi:cysteine dioxygenase